MKTMTEVLEELDKHRPDHREYEGGWWELACAGCDFAKGQRLSHLDWAPYRIHRAEVFADALAAAGYGPVREAAAEALRDAASELATLMYVRPGCEGRDQYEAMLAIRRGHTDTWLKDRAKAIGTPRES